MGIVTQPAVPGDFKEICTFSGIRHEDALQEVASVRRNVLWKGEWSGDNVLVQEVDVISLGIGWVVVEGQVTS